MQKTTLAIYAYDACNAHSNLNGKGLFEYVEASKNIVHAQAFLYSLELGPSSPHRS